MKAVKWTLAVFMLAAVAFAVLFPAFARGRQDVYSEVLRMHHDASEMPQQKGQLPFLYISWFRNGSLKRGQDFAAYDNGDAAEHLILTYAIEGGYGPMQNKAAFQALRRVSSLSPGLPGPDAAPHTRLLIVSLRRGGQWETRYYDRRALPAPIQSIARLVGVGNR